MPTSTYDKYTSLKGFLSSGLRSIDDCVLHMDQNKRTIYRAINVLKKEPGFRTIRKGKNVLFTMEDSSVSEKNNIVYQLEKIIKKSGGSPAEERLMAPLRRIVNSILEKNKNALPDSYSFHDDFIIDLGPTVDCNFNNDLFKRKCEKCLQAIQNHQKIRIQYTHTNNSVTESILVKPYKLIMRIDTLYLWAAQEKNGSEAMFLYVFNQINKIQYLSETFEPIKENPKNLYRYAFAKWMPNLEKDPPTKIVLEATKEWSAQIFKRFNFQKQNAEAIITPTQKNRLELNISITPDFKSWLFGMLDSVKIIKPLSLKKEALKYLQDSINELK